MKKQSIRIGEKQITFETGEIARQADGAVIVKQGDTVILVTAVAEKPKENLGFFPLTVEYREKTAAAGKIPGGFIKRENRPQNHEILTSRLIDRSIRPLFPKNFMAETQIMATVLSFDPSTTPASLAIMGASLALQISNIPWNGPVCGLQLVRLNGQNIVLPNFQQAEKAELDLVISCRKEGLIMLEGIAKEVPEKELQQGIEMAMQEMEPFFLLAEEWGKELGAEKREVPAAEDVPEELHQEVISLAKEKLEKAVVHPSKQQRKENIQTVIDEVTEQLQEKYPENWEQIPDMCGELLHQVVRKYMIREKKRVDGRDFKTIRPISGKIGWLPRNHGSAVFTRGDTQAVVSCTLGTLEDEQIVETLQGETRERFMLHYNFPPFCVGEARPLRGPGRREIGHGNLATRALLNVLPEVKDFPYTIRLVSEVTESNGSSSMATVCGGSLALMEAGIPIKKPVAGIAMGLIQEDDDTLILSDIIGDEDHLGDMDFKVTGTVEGVTALQMDNKIGSLPSHVLSQALTQAKEGRIHILQEMSKILPQTRQEISDFAPRVQIFKIKQEKIRNLIGPGGKHIQDVQNSCNVRVDIDSDTNEVRVYASNAEDGEQAMKKIEYYIGEPEVDKVYRGTVTSVKDFGAFVRLFADTEGLVHISELEHGRVGKVSDVLREGDEVIVRVLGIDRQGKIRLSRKEALDAEDHEIAN